MSEDIRVLVPEVRRAIDGPAATSSAAPSTSLTDDQVICLAADACGDIILKTGGLFGLDLLVMGVDDAYGAPNEWATSQPLTIAQRRLICTQAALSHLFDLAKVAKVSETIQDEGQTWTYSLSSSLLKDQLQFLVSERDAAIADIMEEDPQGMDRWVNFVHERERHWWGYLEQGRGGQPFADPRGFESPYYCP